MLFILIFFRPDRLESQLRTFHSATRRLTLAKQRGNPSPAGNYAPVIKAAVNELRRSKSNTGEIIKVTKKNCCKSNCSEVDDFICWTHVFSFSRHLCGASQLIILAARHGHTQTHTLSHSWLLVQPDTISSTRPQRSSVKQCLVLAGGGCHRPTSGLCTAGMSKPPTISRRYDNLIKCARHPVWTRLCATFECKVNTGELSTKVKNGRLGLQRCCSCVT